MLVMRNLRAVQKMIQELSAYKHYRIILTTQVNDSALRNRHVLLDLGILKKNLTLNCSIFKVCS